MLDLKKSYFITAAVAILVWVSVLSFGTSNSAPVNNDYHNLYFRKADEIAQRFQKLKGEFEKCNLNDSASRQKLLGEIKGMRPLLKSADIWYRYLEPNAYRKLNGPLPVEWENEVFEKFEPPYRRVGSGLSLMETYMEEGVNRDSLIRMADSSLLGMDVFRADSITRFLDKPDHFFYANRLFLLNLGAIYSTGFECPDKENIIPELRGMLSDTREIYLAFNSSFPNYALNNKYLSLYQQLCDYANRQPASISEFDHFKMLKDYVNPLFKLNQEMIRGYRARSANFNDFTLSNAVNSIFDKGLYEGQNVKGIFLPVDDSATLSEIAGVGRLLFYDPILSGNIKRSCFSCHKPDQYFTETKNATSLSIDGRNFLTRNTPSLINVTFQHLIMLDGKHYSLLNQGKDVVINPNEMGGETHTILKNVLSCKEYEQAFKRFVKLTPNSPQIKIDHIISAIMLYYTQFSQGYSQFDSAINLQAPLAQDVIKGYNLFMGKAQCGTCHFPPQFNGVKPPYIGSEFEVLGVPKDTAYSALSPDSGRAIINPAPETLHAFRTSTVRNIFHTGPYMHNGVFTDVDQIIEFYNDGGGIGHKLKVPNQTLSSDSLHLTANEKNQLKAFMRALDEGIIFDTPPVSLPDSKKKELKGRLVGGEY
ncbi:MAG: hypothetical protein KIS82_03100 [Ferruginibacter sp.]|nr:cytochrome C peroxidase [Bacteroidota bacterium]MCW5916315.1 hypothetical protein [Ferruginibacter sp.]